GAAGAGVVRNGLRTGRFRGARPGPAPVAGGAVHHLGTSGARGGPAAGAAAAAVPAPVAGGLGTGTRAGPPRRRSRVSGGCLHRRGGGEDLGRAPPGGGRPYPLPGGGGGSAGGPVRFRGRRRLPRPQGRRLALTVIQWEPARDGRSPPRPPTRRPGWPGGRTR